MGSGDRSQPPSTHLEVSPGVHVLPVLLPWDKASSIQQRKGGGFSSKNQNKGLKLGGGLGLDLSWSLAAP